MSQGGGTTTQQTSQQSAPWAPIQPYLTDVASQAQSLSQQQAGNNQLPGSVAPLSSQTTNALNAGTAYGNGQGSSLISGAQGSLSNLMNPQAAPGSDTLQSLTHGYADPGNATAATFANPNNINPYLSAQYQAASGPVIDQVNAIMGQAGRTGSGADQQLLTRNLGDLASNIFANGYDNAANRSLAAAGQLSGNALNQANVQGQAANNLNSQFNTGNNLMLNAANSAPAANNAGWQNILDQLGVGQAFDTQNNAQLGSQLQQYLYSQEQPWNILKNYSGAVTGLGALGGSSSGTNSTTQPSQSMLPQLLGTGLQAAMMFA